MMLPLAITAILSIGALGLTDMGGRLQPKT